MTEPIKLGLLGNNIGRSRAKNLHELLGELYNSPVTYQPIDLAGRTGPVDICSELERCRQEGYRAVNVTHPYKRDAFGCVTTMAHFPSGLTSVNTVLLQGAVMMADNTDYSGCCRAFRSQFGGGFRPGRVLMLGAGGVGVAIAYALRELAADELVVHDTNQALAAELVRQMTAGGLPARLAGADLVDEMRQSEGLINATPIGMFQYPGNPFPADGFAAQRWGFDAVYTPEKTAFLESCRQRGIATLSGFYLFLFQGLDAFLHFTGIMTEAALVEPEFLKRFPLE